MEKWKPYPTRANIFIDQDTGFLLKRLSSGWHDMLPNQKMGELQEIKSYRRMGGTVRINSGSRWRVAQQVESVIRESHK